MAAGDIYLNPGSEIAFQSAAGDVVITVTSDVAAGDGRASALCTLAAAYDDNRPDEYRWTAKAFWAAGALVGDRLGLFAAEANADGELDGKVAAGDADFTDAAALVSMEHIGDVLCTNETEAQEFNSGVVRLTSNKFVLVVWNYSATATMHATATNFEFKILPIPQHLEA
jgi:hypothetical protein